MPTAYLSPEYGLSPIRLASDKGPPMPGLVLHSHTFTWPFDPDPYVLSGPAELVVRAHRVGLFAVPNPFLPAKPATQSWLFQLPSPVRAASLTGPDVCATIDRPPNITGAWWSMAVTGGAKCVLLIAACVRFPDDPAAAADTLNAAAMDGRVVGASIAVEF